MLVVKIELWPYGSEERKRQIGEVRIANDATGDSVTGNYEFEVKHGGTFFGKPGNYRTGRVTRFTRKLSPYHLLARVFQAAGIN